MSNELNNVVSSEVLASDNGAAQVATQETVAPTVEVARDANASKSAKRRERKSSDKSSKKNAAKNASKSAKSDAKKEAPKRDKLGARLDSHFACINAALSATRPKTMKQLVSEAQKIAAQRKIEMKHKTYYDHINRLIAQKRVAKHVDGALTTYTLTSEKQNHSKREQNAQS